METTLSAAEREALDDYAAAHGRRWKAALRADWMNAMTGWARLCPHGAAELLRLRTAAHFGPRGLTGYRAAPLPAFEASLARYLAEPTLVRWESIYAMRIPPTSRTLWQAWVHVDGGAPTELRGGWAVHPDAFTLRRAIKAARSGEVPVGLGAPRLPVVPR
jgi:hypothetical protein